MALSLTSVREPSADSAAERAAGAPLAPASCPVCGGRQWRPFGEAPHRAGQLHTTQVRCTACGLVAAQPQASAAAMAAYYGGPYYAQLWPDADALFAANVQSYGRELLPWFEALWGPFAPPRNARVAELGCGYGALLEVMRRRGFDVHGAEPSERAAAYCRSQGFTVTCTSGTGSLPRDSFDVVVSAFVLEHVSDPVAFVRDAASLVRPGGIVAIATDNIWTAQYAWERLGARLRGRAPGYRTSTDHTFVFARDHLARIFAQAGCERARTRCVTETPTHESLHWRAYKGAFRTIDRALGLGEFLLGAAVRRN